MIGGGIYFNLSTQFVGLFPFYAVLHFYSTKFQRQMLSFYCYICMTSLVAKIALISFLTSENHVSPNLAILNLNSYNLKD